MIAFFSETIVNWIKGIIKAIQVFWETIRAFKTIAAVGKAAGWVVDACKGMWRVFRGMGGKLGGKLGKAFEDIMEFFKGIFKWGDEVPKKTFKSEPHAEFEDGLILDNVKDPVHEPVKDPFKEPEVPKSASPKHYEPTGPMKGKKVGHTFSKHGSHNTFELQMQAKNSKMPQGQWLDDVAAENFIAENLDKTKNGTIIVELPENLGRVIMPDGTFLKATHAKLVPSGSGVKTAFPLIP